MRNLPKPSSRAISVAIFRDRLPRHPDLIGIPRNDKERGFTLVELLVVIGILSVAFGLFLTIFTKVLQGGNKTQIIGSMKQNGQSLLEKMDKTIREADRIVCVTTPTTDTGDIVAVVQKGSYSKFSFKAPTTVANGYIKQETFLKSDTSAVTTSVFESDICTHLPERDNPQIISDTNIKSGVSIDCIPVGVLSNCGTNPIFKRIRTSGFKDQLEIKFTVKPGVSAPASSTGQIDDINFQTTINLR